MAEITKTGAMHISAAQNVLIKLQDKEVTQNGEYTADDGFDGLGKVTVNVEGGGGGGTGQKAYRFNARITSVKTIEQADVDEFKEFAFDGVMPLNITTSDERGFKGMYSAITIDPSSSDKLMIVEVTLNDSIAQAVAQDFSVIINVRPTIFLALNEVVLDKRYADWIAKVLGVSYEEVTFGGSGGETIYVPTSYTEFTLDGSHWNGTTYTIDVTGQYTQESVEKAVLGYPINSTLENNTTISQCGMTLSGGRISGGSTSLVLSISAVKNPLEVSSELTEIKIGVLGLEAVTE